MTTALQAHSWVIGLPSHVTMHSFIGGGSLPKSLERTAVDEVMIIGG